VEARNHLDGLIYTVEHTLRENAGKIDAEMKQSVETAVQEAKKHLDSRDVPELQHATEQLTQVSQRMSEQLYHAASGPAEGLRRGPGEQGAPGAATGTEGKSSTDEKKPDDVIDADYKEIG
jgi:molecular chaperone DnaK